MNFTDLHTDMPFKLINKETSVTSGAEVHFDKYLQNAAFWFTDDLVNPKERYENYLRETASYIKQKGLKKITLKNFWESGIFLSVENGGFLAKDPDFIYKMAKDGVVIISLTWNGDNPLAGGAKGSGVLSEKGEDIIKRANELGLGLDISHLNEKSALRALELASFPLATHSNCNAVFKDDRNLTDEVLLKIKEKNGLVGLCFYPEFLGGDTVEQIHKNILHLISLGMEKNIAIGSDFDGAEMSEELSCPADCLALYKSLFNMGIKKPVLDGIFYENTIAFFRRMCQNK